MFDADSIDIYFCNLHITCLRTGLLLLLLVQRKERHARHLDALEPHPGNITHGMPGPTERRHEHLVVELVHRDLRHDGLEVERGGLGYLGPLRAGRAAPVVSRLRLRLPAEAAQARGRRQTGERMSLATLGARRVGRPRATSRPRLTVSISRRRAPGRRAPATSA